MNKSDQLQELAREFLAAECDKEGWDTAAAAVRAGDFEGAEGAAFHLTVRAIVAALGSVTPLARRLH